MLLALAIASPSLGRPADAAEPTHPAGSAAQTAQSDGSDASAPLPVATPSATPVPARTVKPKYTPPPLLIPLRRPGSPARTATPIPATTPTFLSAPTDAPTESPAATPASVTPPAAAPPAVPSRPPTATPVPAATASAEPAATPSPAATAPIAPPRNPREHATVAPSLPTVPPLVTPTLAPPPPSPGAQGAPSAASLIRRAIAEARVETQHPYVSYHLHKKLVVSEAFSQDVAYDVVERASDRLTRFQDVTSGTVRVGPPEPRRPDMPPALWGPDARDVNAGNPYGSAPSLLDAVHYDARVVGAETVDTGLAYRVLLEPHDGGLHDVLRSVLIDEASGRIVEVVTRRVVPLRIAVAGRVRDIEIPADVTIDYAFVDGASVISHLRLLGVASGRTADFSYDIDRVAFPATVADDTFKPSAASAPVAAAPGGAADRMPPLAPFGGRGLTVIALGDSLTVGIGTNVCRGGCVTTPARTGSGTDVPGAVQDLALALHDAGARLTFVPLGVAGANTGEAPRSEDPGMGDVLTNSGQLAQLGGAIDAARARGDRIVVMLWAGSDDVFDAFYATECLSEGGRVLGATSGKLPCASAGTTLAGPLGEVTGGSFYRGYLRVIRAVGLAKPDVIVAMNVEDVSRLPKSLVLGTAERRRLEHDVELANEAIVDAARDSAAASVALVDLFEFANGRPELFSAPYVAADGLHPSELGYRAIAAEIAQVAGKTIEGLP